MKAIHSYKRFNGKFVGLQLLTQLLSVVKWKHVNPDIPFHLYTCTKTLQEFKRYGLDEIYDQVNLQVLDSYPLDRINNDVFWASPKLWTMKHQTEPFCILDTDLVWHKPITNLLNYDIAFLHTESTYVYPDPIFIETPIGFEWTDDELDAFEFTLPVNCAFTVWNSIELLNTYIERYFQFVFDNPGKYKIPNKYLNETYTATGPQILIEQWWLSALMHLNQNYKSHSILNSIAFPRGFKSQLYNMNSWETENELNQSMFHLWGAKRYLNESKIHEYEKIFQELKQAIIYYNPNINDTLSSIIDYCEQEISMFKTTVF